jgi:uncharacterized membrane protein
VNKPSVLAFLSYLLLVPGWLFVLLFDRKDEFAVYHAKQSMVLTLFAIGAPLVWAVVGWIISWIPALGFVIAVALFTMVIAAYALIVVDWIMGMVYALQSKAEPLPVVGRWAQRIPI